MPLTTRQIGDANETLARHYLEAKGFTLVEKNFNCKFGEIDLVMIDHDYLVFVEVRYRTSMNFGSGAETVNQAKQSKLITSALCFLQRHKKFAQWNCRFDILSITRKNQQPAIEWIPDAFQA
ncbi:MAG: YraN family protein [Gammaproteobacteria bacterium]|nr:YraN family protein [Gammaproteobacteria bacterium]